MARDVSDATPIGARSELVDWVASGEKPRDAGGWAPSTKKFHSTRRMPRPFPMMARRASARLLEGLQARTGWEPIIEDGQSYRLVRRGRRRSDFA